MRLIVACCLIVLPICSLAQNVGDSYWYDPSHDKWVPTEFYSIASPESAVIRFTRKTRIQVVAARRGWLAIRPAPGSENVNIVYMPLSMFKFRLYQAGEARDERTALAAFQRSSLFAGDPDVLKRRFEKKDDETRDAPKAKPTAKLKPWQKYKENWGSVTPAPAANKKKHTLLDDIKQPEAAADATPTADGSPAADAKP